MVRSPFQVAVPFAVLVFALAVQAPPTAVATTPPCAACIAILLDAGQTGTLPERLNGLDVLVDASGPGASSRTAAALDTVRAREGRAGAVVGVLAAPAEAEVLSKADVLLVDAGSSSLDAETLTYALRTRLTALRAHSGPGVRIGIAPPHALASTFERDLGVYWDFLVRDEARGGNDPRIWLREGELVDLEAALARDGARRERRRLWVLLRDPERARTLLAGLARAAALLPAGLVAAADVEARCGDRPVEMYLNPATLDRVGIAVPCSADAPLSVTPQSSAERVQLAPSMALIRIPNAGRDRFASGVDVSAARRLTAEEIVARHQTAAARQASRVHTLISSGTLTVTFEAPGFPAPVTVSSQTVLYRDERRTDLVQRDLRVNGVAFGSRAVPRLPIIEPERVSAPPLTITLSDKYRYVLAGEESRGEVGCYVLDFEPLTGEPLFRGRAWIARDDFGLVRVAAAQTGLRGSIVSSEQTDEFERASTGIWVLARSEVHQNYQGAAYRTPIHRVLELPAHAINAENFEARRKAAYASDSIILRDTPQGYRYVERAERMAGEPSESALRSRAPGTAATKVRTLAFGLIVDPNISRPLPFAGLSYLDFDLFGTGAQLNGFFGGTFGQLAFSVPSLRGTKWQLAGRAFGIASSYNDRAFSNGREQYELNVRQRPAFGSIWLLRPLTPRIAIRAGYELEYTHLRGSDVTASDFVVPADQLAHGLRLALEAQRAGWDATVWWNPARRSGWRAWGRPGSVDYEPGDRDFQRYGGSLTRAIVFSPRLVARLEATAVGGRDLDRFSRYTFGAFDNRLHGYPSALIRYDRGGVARGTVAWSPGRLFRLDGFADLALVRDRGFSRGVSRFAGFGAAVEAPAPFGTLAAIEWGYGVQGVNSDGRRGTHVVRISGYKMF